MMTEHREEIIFRKATAGDLDAIAAIYEHTHTAEETGDTTTGWVRGIYPVRATAEQSIARDDMYVAELDGNIVAAGIINQIQVNVYLDCDWKYQAPDDQVSVLHTMVVEPAYRGMGIGPTFVKFWEDFSRSHGRCILRIDTNARNVKARKMYAKLGYLETDIVPTTFNGIHGVDLVLLEKRIDTPYVEHMREMQDVKYADFQAKLIPGTDRAKFIGVRTPQLRSYAKELVKAGCADDLIKQLPHRYFDENQLHAFIISEIRDFDRCVFEVERFLPYVDNWATCDQLSPKAFARHKKELLDHIGKWLASDQTYTVRFGIGMLMQHYLDKDFDLYYMNRIAAIRSDEYYINMMIAWYFATALAKQYDAAMTVIKENRLDVWTHNKAIQKAIESRRITPDQKELLRTLKRKS